MKSNKTHITFLTVFALVGILFISGCGKNNMLNNSNNSCGIDPTAIKATVNGGTFSNQTFSLAAATQCVLLYSSKTDTICMINSSGITSQSSSNSFHILVEFIGTGTGPYTIESASGITAIGKAYVQLDITIGSTITTLYSQSGTLTVTELGASGGKMSASFSGTFTDSNGNTYTVTNGFASGIRI